MDIPPAHTLLSESALFAEVTVFESQEVQDAVKADGVDTLLCILHHAGLCMKGNA